MFQGTKLVRVITSYHNLNLENEQSSIVVKHKNDCYKGHVMQCNPPIFIKEYNKYMGGVDIVNQALSYYTILRKTSRWTLKLSMHLIQIIIFNAYVLHKERTQDHKKVLSHIEFNFEAIEWFIRWSEDNEIKINSNTPGMQSIDESKLNEDTQNEQTPLPSKFKQLNFFGVFYC